jgi:hypothetical protein
MNIKLRNTEIRKGKILNGNTWKTILIMMTFATQKMERIIETNNKIIFFIKSIYYYIRYKAVRDPTVS